MRRAWLVPTAMAAALAASAWLSPTGGQLVYRHGAATAYADTARNANVRNVSTTTTSTRDVRSRDAVDHQDR